MISEFFSNLSGSVSPHRRPPRPVSPSPALWRRECPDVRPRLPHVRGASARGSPAPARGPTAGARAWGGRSRAQSSREEHGRGGPGWAGQRGRGARGARPGAASPGPRLTGRPRCRALEPGRAGLRRWARAAPPAAIVARPRGVLRAAPPAEPSEGGWGGWECRERRPPPLCRGRAGSPGGRSRAPGGPSPAGPLWAPSRWRCRCPHRALGRGSPRPGRWWMCPMLVFAREEHSLPGDVRGCGQQGGAAGRARALRALRWERLARGDRSSPCPRSWSCSGGHWAVRRAATLRAGTVLEFGSFSAACLDLDGTWSVHFSVESVVQEGGGVPSV